MATCKLGKGASASVFMVASLPERAKKPEAKGPFALRQVKITSSKKRSAIETEIQLYNQIVEKKIPGFATLVYWEEIIVRGRSYFHLYLEYCNGGDLFDYIYKRGRPFSEKTCRQVMMQLGTALARLHQMGVTHGDFKPENVVFKSWESVGFVEVKFFIIDLETAVHVKTEQDTKRKQDVKTEQVECYLTGSLSYLAPELVPLMVT